jgi:DNA-binding transcriptional LysR family regulator
LGVTQPTVSQAIREFERGLGAELFHRLGRGMVLSAAGRSIVGPARQILRDITSVPYVLSSTPDRQLRGRLDILAFPTMVVGPLLDLIARFRRTYPHVRIRLGELHDENQIAAFIADGQCEFAVAHLPVAEALAVHHLGEHEYWFAYPPGTDVPAGPVMLSAMPDVPMILAPGGHSFADDIAESIRSAGAHPRLAVLSAQREMHLPMVLAGVGVALVERTVAESVSNRAVVRPVSPRLIRSIGIAFDESSLSPIGRAFAQMVASLGEPASSASRIE